jgi:hypothetical protein
MNESDQRGQVSIMMIFESDVHALGTRFEEKIKHMLV